jgi:uncharacterized membrane protein YdjX (TVP38/TMEM64 family)
MYATLSGMKTKTKSILTGLIVLLLFVGAELITKAYTQEITTIIESYGIEGKILFTALAMIAVVIPIWSNIFLIPFGVVSWGSFLTAIFCITGWFFGSVVSFYIARTYKEWLLTKYASLRKYEFIDTLIPQEHVFWSLIFLRMTMPVDILSYGLGLFSKRITWKQNALTTIIGITPFGFVFSYIGIFDLQSQILIFGSTVIIFSLYVFVRRKYYTTQN